MPSAARYEIDIQMSQDTVRMLVQSGYALCAFKAVQANSSGGGPLVWWRTNQLLTTTSISWQGDYQAYISQSQIIPNGVIRVASAVTIVPGQTADVAASGTLNVSGGGPASAISILNQTTSPWTCGVAQMVEGQANPVCALPLFGNMLVAVTPVEKVLLMFSTNPVVTGTVAYRAYSAALLVDLQTAAQRRVGFDINRGWTWDGSPWARQVPAQSDLVPLLIQS